MPDESSPLRRLHLSPRQRAILAKYGHMVHVEMSTPGMPHQEDFFRRAMETPRCRDRICVADRVATRSVQSP